MLLAPAPEHAEQPAPLVAIRVLEERDRDHLDVIRRRDRTQVSGERRIVARQQRRQQDQVRNAVLEDGERGVARIDEDQIDAGQRPDGAPDGIGLRGVGFDGKNERHEWRDPSIRGLEAGSCRIGATGPSLASFGRGRGPALGHSFEIAGRRRAVPA